ncbi:unnamed protein product [Microthlaspi erraticum]|uniref:Uncharacterized protein n=1 Tax=Microthlaspi erraticum TaxID=1685480 RepID=A0A6D2J0D1_9BRAS|nr:unnamed protein product [Microthlaspi erraticum]
MIAEHDSASFRRIRLFLFPKPPPSESDTSRCSVSVNRLLGLESPIQKIAFTSSSSVLPIPIFPPNNYPAPARQCDDYEKVDATAEENQKTAEENRKQDEALTASASLLLPENTAAADAGGVSDKETEKVKIQDQSRSIVQEPMPQQQQPPLIVYYVPVWQMQAHMVTNQVSAYALSPATENSSRLDLGMLYRVELPYPTLTFK